MQKNYLYNPKTRALHIRGYCYHTKCKNPGFIPFSTENEAIAYDGRAVGVCKLCQKKREQIEKENKQ